MTSNWESDPEEFFGKPGNRNADVKTLRLCRQVSEAVQTALSGECGDELLQQLWVCSVKPGPDASRLCVTVSAPESLDPAEVLARLAAARGLLRSAVAAGVHRKKVPELFFRLAGPEEAAT